MLFFIFFLSYFLGIFYIISLTRKKASLWFDIGLMLLATGVYFVAAKAYIEADSLNSWGIKEFLITASLFVVFNLFLLWEVIQRKRYGLLTPLILTAALFLLKESLLQYKKSTEITFQNFPEKLPALSQAIKMGDINTFEKELDKHSDIIDSIDHILYSKCTRGEGKGEKNVNICSVLIKRKYICTFCFDDIIKLALGSGKNEFTALLPALNALLLDSERRDYHIKDVSQRLTSESAVIRFKYLQSLLKAVNGRDIVIPVDGFDMYYPRTSESINAYLGCTKLILNNKTNFFNNQKELDKYLSDIQDDIVVFEEKRAEWVEIKQSFIDDLKAILQRELNMTRTFKDIK